MGLVLGVEAAVGIAEAAEAGTVAGEAVATAADAGEAIGTATEAGADAGTEAGGEAASGLGDGGDALDAALKKLYTSLEKIEKMVVEYQAIDATFKAAKAILEKLTSDPAARARALKLGKLINVLNQSSNIMQELCKWLKTHSSDTTNISEYTVTVQGLLSKFLPKLGAVRKFNAI